MSDQTLYDLLMELCLSGDLVPQWDDDPIAGRYCEDMMLKFRGERKVTDWYLRNDDDILTEALFGRGFEIADVGIEDDDPEALGSLIIGWAMNVALLSVYRSDDWERLRAEITRRENQGPDPMDLAKEDS